MYHDDHSGQASAGGDRRLQLHDSAGPRRWDDAFPASSDADDSDSGAPIAPSLRLHHSGSDTDDTDTDGGIAFDMDDADLATRPPSPAPELDTGTTTPMLLDPPEPIPLSSLMHHHAEIPSAADLAASLDVPISQIEQVGVPTASTAVVVEDGFYIAMQEGGSMASQTSPPQSPDQSNAPSAVANPSQPFAPTPASLFPPSHALGLDWQSPFLTSLAPYSWSSLAGSLADDEHEGGLTDLIDGDITYEDYDYNPDFAIFFQRLWNRQAMSRFRADTPKVTMAATRIAEWAKLRPPEVTAEDVRRTGDTEGIDWLALGITREQAREVRRHDYINYRNIRDSETEDVPPLRESRRFYNFHRLDTTQACRRTHFQLRNILGVTSRNDIFYGSESRVMRTNGSTGSTRTLMDVNDIGPAPCKISTLAAAHDIVLAGGFHGEYALKRISAAASSRMVTGIITQHSNGITNHVQLIQSRTTSNPMAVFSSNDSYIRILDCATLRWTASHEFPFAVNCSATSPDTRLRAVVGDSEDVLITAADSGRTEATLGGHRDYGFAVAWSDDARHVATGNQDQTVRIYDARNWGRALRVLPTRMAGCRALRFRPGDGAVLAAAEAADYVHLVDARSWHDEQVLEFWGEVGGIEFSPSGDELWVANVDPSVGGLMEFSRSRVGTEEVPRSRGWSPLWNDQEGDLFEDSDDADDGVMPTTGAWSGAGDIFC